jgi:DNA (cytosine-5)-methyltransferase 1
MGRRLLDLFCGAGGAAMGFYRAGFEVVGVDINPQPHYPFRFIRADVFDFLATEDVSGYDVIHASPPCQRYSNGNALSTIIHPKLIAPTREALVATGKPYVIENVERAPLIAPVVLCGTSFGLQAEGFEIRRHRIFEATFPIAEPTCRHRLPAIPAFGHGPGANFYRLHGRGISAQARKLAMGIDWMNRDELAEAIPPAFTEYVGTFALASLAAPERQLTLFG